MSQDRQSLQHGQCKFHTLLQKCKKTSVVYIGFLITDLKKLLEIGFYKNRFLKYCGLKRQRFLGKPIWIYFPIRNRFSLKPMS